MYRNSEGYADPTAGSAMSQRMKEYRQKQKKRYADKNRRKMFAAEVKSAEDYDPEERMMVAKMLNDNLLTYHFQPIVSTSDGSIFSYEALMRSKTDKMISPLDIIKYANNLQILKPNILIPFLEVSIQISYFS